jgi:hypothetical protein
MSSQRRYSDDDLTAAVRSSRSWRGVMRELGLSATSAGAQRSVRRHVARLGLDATHFTGQRRWTDGDLVVAVMSAGSWLDVADHLGLASAGGSTFTQLRAHSERLGLAVGHRERARRPIAEADFTQPPDRTHLSRSASLMAAGWFAIRGYNVSWPLEPCRYDLLVDAGVRTVRIQVKTTIAKSDGSWIVRISSTRRSGVAVYGPDEVDYFFVIDGDYACYLIPLAAVGGYQAIVLSCYAAYAVAPAWAAAG